MVTVVGKRRRDSTSNQLETISQSVHTLGKVMDISILLPIMGK